MRPFFDWLMEQPSWFGFALMAAVALLGAWLLGRLVLSGTEARLEEVVEELRALRREQRGG